MGRFFAFEINMMRKILFLFGISGIILFFPIQTNAGQPTAHPAVDGSILYTYTSTCPSSETHRNEHGIIIPENMTQVDEIYLYFHGRGASGTLGPTPQDMCSGHKICKNAAILKNQYNKNLVVLVPEGVKAPNGGNKNFTKEEMTCYLSEAYEQISGITHAQFQKKISAVSGHSAGGFEIMHYLRNSFQAGKVLVFDGCYDVWCQDISSNHNNIYLYASKNGTREATNAIQNATKKIVVDQNHNDIRVNCFLDHVNNNNCVSQPPPEQPSAGNQNTNYNQEAVNSVDEFKETLYAPQPKINIPGLNFSDPPKITKDVDPDTGQENSYIFVPFIGEYLGAVYKYAVVAATVLSIVMIIIAGLQWTLSGGNAESVGKAQKRIQNSVIGLILAVGSYMILFTINPDLVTFKSLKVLYNRNQPLQIEYISQSDYSAITGQNIIPKSEILKKAVETGKQVGLQDPCFMITLIGKESGGNPNAIGHDENYPRPKACVGSRTKFLLEGLTYKKQSFKPPVDSPNKYSCKEHNGYTIEGKIVKNDDKFDPNSPPDYGLDWRYTHGFGLGQTTLRGDMYCNGQRGITKYGRCFNIPDLLQIDSSIFFTANLFKDNLACAKRKGWNGDNQIKAAFWAYAAGCGAVEQNTGQDISDKGGVPRAWKHYTECKTFPEKFGTIDPEPKEDGTEAESSGTTSEIICPNSAVKILAIGDSITANTASYVNQLNTKCQNQINFEKIAEDGKQTSWMLQNLQNKTGIRENFSYMVVLGGINNIDGVSGIKNNLTEIYKIGKDNGLKVIAITIPPYYGWSTWTQQRHENILTVNAWIKEQKTAGKIDSVVDYFSVAVSADGITAKPELTSSDHLHPTAAGHTVIAKMISPLLN